jgi:hypothetical protein
MLALSTTALSLQKHKRHESNKKEAGSWCQTNFKGYFPFPVDSPSYNLPATVPDDFRTSSGHLSRLSLFTTSASVAVLGVVH